MSARIGNERRAADQGAGWLFLVEEEYRLGQLAAEYCFVGRLVERLSDPEHVRAWRASVPAAAR